MQFTAALLAALSLTSVVESSPCNINKSAIRIYYGPGVSVSLVDEAMSLFSNLLSSRHSFHKIGPEELAESDWISDTSLLIIPGGQATPYSSSLKGRANDNIKRYVIKGGSFMGYCAGAYYSSRVTEFMVGTDQEKVVVRDFFLFKGTSRGTAFPGYKLNTKNGALAAEITYYLTDETKGYHTSVYYNGGGILMNLVKQPGVEILATYNNLPDNENVAAIYLPYGKGRVILSHVHPEYIPDKRGKLFYDEISPKTSDIINLNNSWLRKLNLKLRSDDIKIQSQKQTQTQIQSQDQSRSQINTRSRHLA